MKNLTIIFLLLATGYFNALEAQEGATCLSIQLLNEHHKPLAFAAVSVYQGDSLLCSQYTDTLGKMKFRVQQARTLSFQIQYLGFDTVLVFNDTTSIPTQIVIKSQAQQLESIKVVENSVEMMEDWNSSRTRSCYGNWSICNGRSHDPIMFKLSTMGGMHYLDGSPTHIGNILNIQPYD